MTTGLQTINISYLNFKNHWFVQPHCFFFFFSSRWRRQRQISYKVIDRYLFCFFFFPVLVKLLFKFKFLRFYTTIGPRRTFFLRRVQYRTIHTHTHISISSSSRKVLHVKLKCRNNIGIAFYGKRYNG